MERRLPGTVWLSLQERRPFAIWQNQGKYLLVDRAGQIVADQDVAQFRRLPLIVGRGAPLAAAGASRCVERSPRVGRKSPGERSGRRAPLEPSHDQRHRRYVAGGPRGRGDRSADAAPAGPRRARPALGGDRLRLPDRLVLRPAPGSSDIDVTPPLPPGGPHPVALPPPTVPVVAKKPT